MIGVLLIQQEHLLLEIQLQILLNYLVQTEQLNKMLRHLLQDSVQHGNVVVSNVKGNFIEGETIVGQTSNNSATIQARNIRFRRC